MQRYISCFSPNISDRQYTTWVLFPYGFLGNYSPWPGVSEAGFLYLYDVLATN